MNNNIDEIIIIEKATTDTSTEEMLRQAVCQLRQEGKIIEKAITDSIYTSTDMLHQAINQLQNAELMNVSHYEYGNKKAEAQREKLDQFIERARKLNEEIVAYWKSL